MLTPAEAQERNRALAQAILDDVLSGRDTTHCDKYVGFVNGERVLVSEDLEDLVARIDEREPDPRRTLVFFAGVSLAAALRDIPPGLPPPVPLDEAFAANVMAEHRLKKEAQGDPNSPYRGKWVGLVNGQVAVVDDDIDTVEARLDEIEPDVRQTMLVRPDEPDVVVDLWY